jgi:hypothetical protein
MQQRPKTKKMNSEKITNKSGVRGRRVEREESYPRRKKMK